MEAQLGDFHSLSLSKKGLRFGLSVGLKRPLGGFMVHIPDWNYVGYASANPILVLQEE